MLITSTPLHNNLNHSSSHKSRPRVWDADSLAPEPGLLKVFWKRLLAALPTLLLLLCATLCVLCALSTLHASKASDAALALAAQKKVS